MFEEWVKKVHSECLNSGDDNGLIGDLQNAALEIYNNIDESIVGGFNPIVINSSMMGTDNEGDVRKMMLCKMVMNLPEIS